ncbi:hypothetical protein [Gracilimonas tropica]|uniref:hypothetical protein n=1 Tax=Gracilimonas tropica TaxID=454600 RepID=UPI00037319C9|nr:hypothetical protein [Gracilimonas tropica]
MDLASDLKKGKKNIDEFFDTAKRVLSYMPNVISESKRKDHYVIHKSTSAGSTKFLRPINEKLFISDPSEFEEKYKSFMQSVALLKKNRTENDFSKSSLEEIDSVLYTIQQSLGCGMDLLINANSARKHIGNRLEELMKCIFTEIGITNKKVVLKIPYEQEGKTKTYKCENDLILSPYKKIRSSSTNIDENEIVVSVKTSSKDRMGKIFIDKMLLTKFVGHSVKVIGIFLNDVQRKKSNNVSFTLVSGTFMVYTNFLTELEGVYYLDSPPQAEKEPHSRHLHQFSELLTKHVWQLLAS